MNHYSTVTEALRDLMARGYTPDFALLLKRNCVFFTPLPVW